MHSKTVEQRQLRVRSLMYHIDERLSYHYNFENTELIVCGYVRDEAERKWNFYVPEEIVVLIFNYVNASVAVNDFIFRSIVNSGWASKIIEVTPKHGMKNHSFAMTIFRKKRLKERNMIHITMQEYKALCSVGYHPYINCIHYAWQTKTNLIVIRDYYIGGELFMHLKKQRRFKESTVKIWIAQLILAIGHLHANDVFDCDISPETILLDEGGNIHLNKLVMKHALEDDETPNLSGFAHPGMGALEYFAPELLQNVAVTKSSDWWTVGTLLYELLVGTHPFYSQNLNQMYRRILEMDPVFPGHLQMSDAAKDLISSLLQKDPKQRLSYDDIKAHDFFTDLNWDKIEKKQIETEYKKKLNTRKLSMDMDIFTGQPWYDTLMEEEDIEHDNDFPEFKPYPISFVSEKY